MSLIVVFPFMCVREDMMLRRYVHSIYSHTTVAFYQAAVLRPCPYICRHQLATPWTSISSLAFISTYLSALKTYWLTNSVLVNSLDQRGSPRLRAWKKVNWTIWEQVCTLSDQGSFLETFLQCLLKSAAKEWINFSFVFMMPISVQHLTTNCFAARLVSAW